jgi:hypothetical protein
LFHGEESLADSTLASNAAVNPVMPAPMIATDFIKLRAGVVEDCIRHHNRILHVSSGQ